jgi:hypothetical protein
MTLVNKTMIMGSLLAIFVVTGMSGIAYSDSSKPLDDGIVYGNDTDVVRSCEELKHPGGEVYGIKKTTETMRADFGVWVQDKEDDQYFKMGYDFPQTIYKYVKAGDWGFTSDRCDVQKYLTKISFMVESKIFTNGSKTITDTCYNRGHTFYSHTQPIEENKPLSDTVDGFPSTDGVIDLACTTDEDITFQHDSYHTLSVKATYYNSEKNSYSSHRLVIDDIELPSVYVKDVNPPKWD